MPENPLISVIIPVYNVASYLPRCLDSVCNQTYKNLEIILVDDGSTDNSAEICKDYASKDNRITVIHQKNAGLSAARNSGMERMQGEFFTFIDSDDWVAPDYCQTLFERIEQTQADVSAGNFVYALEDGRMTPSSRSVTAPAVYQGEDILLFGFNFHHTAWLKLYRTARCGTLRFNPYYSLNEDLDFYFRLTQQIKTLACTDKILLYYYQRNNSLLHKANVSGRWKIFCLFQEIEDFCMKNHFQKCFKQAHLARLGYGCVLTMLLVIEKPFDPAEKLQQMHTWITQNRREIFAFKEMKNFGHAFIRCFYYFPRLTVWLCRLPGVRILLKNILQKRLSI